VIAGAKSRAACCRAGFPYPVLFDTFVASNLCDIRCVTTAAPAVDYWLADVRSVSDRRNRRSAPARTVRKWWWVRTSLFMPAESVRPDALLTRTVSTEPMRKL
jgi:hypothetical protein